MRSPPCHVLLFQFAVINTGSGLNIVMLSSDL